MAEITIQVPDGEYCRGCPLLEINTHSWLPYKSKFQKHSSTKHCRKFNKQIHEYKCPACLKAIKQDKRSFSKFML